MMKSNGHYFHHGQTMVKSNGFFGSYIYYYGMLFPCSWQKVLDNITRGWGNHLSSNEFITRGLRPLVINSLLWLVITSTTRDIIQYFSPAIWESPSSTILVFFNIYGLTCPNFIFIITLEIFHRAIIWCGNWRCTRQSLNSYWIHFGKHFLTFTI